MLLLLICVFFGSTVNGISEERSGRFFGGVTIVKTVVNTVTSSQPQYCYLLPTGTVPLCRRKRQWLNFQEQGYPYFRYPEQPSGVEIPYELLKSGLDAIEAESDQEPQLRSSLENEERFLPLPLPVPIPIPIKKINLPNIFAPMMNIQKTVPGGQVGGGGGAGGSFGVGGGLSGNILGLGGGVSGGASVGVRPIGNVPGLGMRTVTVTSTAVVKGPTQTLSVACLVPGLAYNPPCPLSVDIPIDCSNLPDLEAFVTAMNLALGGEAEIEASIQGCSRRKRSEKKNGRIRVKAKGRGGGRLTPDMFKQLLSKICGDSCTIGTVKITVNKITFPDYLRPNPSEPEPETPPETTEPEPTEPQATETEPTEPEPESTEAESEERKAAHQDESPTSPTTPRTPTTPTTEQTVPTMSLPAKTVPKTQPTTTTTSNKTSTTAQITSTTSLPAKAQPTTTKP
ncbi:uncharacterized protein LOC136029115 isoform X2 [Artemia franciscana]|uniref:uncharacterized protein LOC136029115 isoform X2 n=1 Tax=Artemia franciscana TaxID=6661 RepID=UPI0032DA26BC